MNLFSLILIFYPLKTWEIFKNHKIQPFLLFLHSQIALFTLLVYIANR